MKINIILFDKKFYIYQTYKNDHQPKVDIFQDQQEYNY